MTNVGIDGQVVLLAVFQVATQEPRRLPHCGFAVTLDLWFLGWILYIYPADEERVEGYVDGFNGLGLKLESITSTTCLWPEFRS